MFVGLIKFAENAPGRPADPTACCKAATPASTSTVFGPLPTGTSAPPAFAQVYVFVGAPTWNISEPTAPPAKYVLIRSAVCGLFARYPVPYVQKPPATTPGLGA